MKLFLGRRGVSACLTVTFLSTCLSARAQTRVPGVVDGFQTTDKDGIVDAALVIPTLLPSDVLNFDLNGYLGPDEKAKAGPISADVPGNTFIPRQKEKYGWITVTLEKSEFGLIAEPSKPNELSALWFSAPFDMLIDAANGKAQVTDLLKAAKFRKSGFAGMRDWAREKKIFLSLDKELKSLGSAKWSRAQAPQNYGDTIVVFQQTPANRWALSGFIGGPALNTQISSVDSLSTRLKVMALRSEFYGDELLAAQGWIVEAKRNSKVVFDNVPSPLSDVTLSGTKVKWKNPPGPGWMGVLYQPKGLILRKQDSGFFDGVFPMLRVLPQVTFGSQITWVDSKNEEFDLNKVIGPKDGLTLIHIGTTKEVSAPKAEDTEEPELFTFAQSIRTIVVR